nr:Gfo/Idh/MocA family oxidoreductase [Kineosporia babensis]
MIGCGNIALNAHLPAFLADPERYQVVAVADPTPARLQMAAEATHAQAYVDPLEAICAPEVDIVDVCTPQHLRRDLLIAAAEAGKHIICEKPLASIPADAEAAVKAAEAAGVVLGVVHNYLFLPEITTALRIIASGELGAVRAVTVNYLGVLDLPGAGSYRPLWRHDPAAAGGGVLMDMLHAVYLAEHLLGAPFVRVSGFADADLPGSRGDGVETMALARFEADVGERTGVAMVNMAWGHGPGGVQVTGTEGRLMISYVDDSTPPWAPLAGLTVTTVEGTRREDVPTGVELPQKMSVSMADALADIADAVASGGRPAATGRDALHTLACTMATYTSAALGRTVPIKDAGAPGVWSAGVGALAGLEMPAHSPVARGRLFRGQQVR